MHLLQTHYIESTDQLSQLGLDSLMIMELRNVVRAELGVVLSPDALVTAPRLRRDRPDPHATLCYTIHDRLLRVERARLQPHLLHEAHGGLALPQEEETRIGVHRREDLVAAIVHEERVVGGPLRCVEEGQRVESPHEVDVLEEHLPD